MTATIPMSDTHTHHTDARYCKISFESPEDRKKALHELIHVIHANFSGVGHRQIVISKEICDELGKNIT